MEKIKNEPVKVDNESLQFYINTIPELIEKNHAKIFENKEEYKHMGDDAEKKVKTGLEFLGRILQSVIAIGDTTLLSDQLVWAKQRLPLDGI